MLLTFHIQLADVSEPLVWRRVTVPGDFSFARFHYVIQMAFGWQDTHLYQFSEKGYRSEVFIGEPSEDSFEEIEDSYEIKLSDIFKRKGKKFVYIYDFGDDWTHIIKLEKIDKIEAKHADCLAGGGKCPPEDCGGPWGYEELKDTLTNPDHPNHEEMKEWLEIEEDEQWNAEDFDIEAAKEAVSDV